MLSMSLLEELRTKRRLLAPTVTTLTYPDGRKYLLSGSGVVEAPKDPFGFVVDTRPDDVPAKIVDFLYLGSQDCCDPDVLSEFRIGSVLSVGVEAPVECANVNYKFVQCLDLPETDVRDILKESVGFIEEEVRARRNVLVHCNAGVSRSATVVIGYLMVVCGYEYPDAYCIVKQSRSCVRPNDGFVAQLKQLNSK